MNHTPTAEEEIMLAMYYDMVEEIMNAAETCIQMHPEDKPEQTRKMIYLFKSVMAAFVDSLPGIQEADVVLLSKQAYAHAQKLNAPPENGSLN